MGLFDVISKPLETIAKPIERTVRKPLEYGGSIATPIVKIGSKIVGTGVKTLGGAAGAVQGIGLPAGMSLPTNLSNPLGSIPGDVLTGGGLFDFLPDGQTLLIYGGIALGGMLVLNKAMK